MDLSTLEEKYLILPWELITKERLEECGYSGIVIKALRAKTGMSPTGLAEMIGKKRKAIIKAEKTSKIGIKLAKLIATAFALEDYRILRNNPFDVE